MEVSMKGSLLYFLFSVFLLSKIFSVAHHQINKQKPIPDEIFI